MNNIKIHNKRKYYIIVTLIMLAFSFVFLNSFYWPYDEISLRKIVVWSLAIAMVIVVPIIAIKLPILYQMCLQVGEAIKQTCQNLLVHKKRAGIFGVLIVAGVVLSLMTTKILSKHWLKGQYNPKLFAAVLAIYMLFAITIFMWKTLAKRVECFFVIIALIMGVFSISVTPNRVGISWDDEIHYARTLEISNFLNGIMYIADERNINEYANNIYEYVGFDRESATQYDLELTTSYEFDEWNSHDFWDYGVGSIAYIPAAIGIIFARGLNLSYIDVFNVGRFVNLVGYALLIYFSMRRLKHGKMIIATIGLIPTTIFMASSYSYDWWVTGFTILGFSYFFAELQEDTLLSNKNMIIMIGALMLGCIPKAIYFPIFFPLLFMPKNKFKNSKQRVWYYLLILTAGMLLVASFMLPRLLNGMGVGDARGGEDVNSTEQVIYILQNPGEFTKTLFNFLKYYISPQSTGPMLQRLAYVGEGEFYGIVGLIIFVVAFLDREDSYKNNFVVRCTGMIGCIVALILSTTALYISFTAVGADSVAGMQGRYMIPFIFPTLYCMGTSGTRHRIHKSVFVSFPMVIIALSFIYNMIQLCVIRY